MTVTARFALVPRDGLFCKDGRGWHTSASGRGHTLEWPWPSTVLGALRTAWGRGEESRSGDEFGPDEWYTRTAEIQLRSTLVLRREPHDVGWSAGCRVWPVPSDALWLEDGEVCGFEPVPPTVPTLGRDDDGEREALWRPRLENAAKPLPSSRWWGEDVFATWLAGRSIPTGASEKRPALHRRIQAHVRIRPDELTADEGILFSHDVVETLEKEAEWAIGVEVTLPGETLPGLARLGSDGRLVWIEPLPEGVFDPPEPVLDAFRAKSPGLRLVVVTPACFNRGWLPDGLERREGSFRGRLAGIDSELVLRAAFVPRPLHVSGWDMANGAPKPTSRMVPPGAVYFLERADGQSFDEVTARALWLKALGARTEEGFGRVVAGVWNPSRSGQ
jgi:CRISPR-associated protein Cmr3